MRKKIRKTAAGLGNGTEPYATGSGTYRLLTRAARQHSVSVCRSRDHQGAVGCYPTAGPPGGARTNKSVCPYWARPIGGVCAKTYAKRPQVSGTAPSPALRDSSGPR